MKQKLRFCKRIFALVLALSMVFSLSDVNMMTAKAAEEPINSSIAKPFGDNINYNAGTGKIDIVWGRNETSPTEYCVSITGVDTEYEEVHDNIPCAAYSYGPEEGYVAGKTYKVEIQSKVDGEYSEALSKDITIPGGEDNEGGEGEGGNGSEGEGGNGSEGEGGNVVDPDVKYIDFTQLDHSVDVFKDGNNIVTDYGVNQFTATGSVWGTGWGDRWETQLFQLIPVTTGEKYTVKFTIESEVSRTAFVKIGDKANEGTVFAEQEIPLVGKEPQTIELTTNADVNIDTLMVLFALGGFDQQDTVTVSNLSVKGETSGYVDMTPYIDFTLLDHSVDVFKDGNNIQTQYDKRQFTATGSVWGTGWGDRWETQLFQLIPVTTGEKYTVKFTIESEVSRTAFVKIGDKANEGTVFAEQEIPLVGGEPQTIELTTNANVDIDTLMVLFALGGFGQQDTVTVSDMTVYGETSGYVVLAPTIPAEKGKEYDFSADAAEDNAANDVADPGKTKENYTLIWADEFDGNYGEANVDADTGLNLDNWAYQLGDGTTDCSNPGWGNAELQCYTDDVKNIGVNEDLNDDGVKEGVLRITGSYEETPVVYETESAKNYTSARIRSTQPNKELFNTTYGYVEARISLPQTQGAWPAFWMLPQSTSIYGGWPVSGELDIMETTGKNTDSACGTLHWGAPDHVYKGSGYVTLDSEISYFHTYAVDWEPNSITWYFDGKPIYTSTNWESGTAAASDKTSFDAPFDQPFYMLLNLAIDSGRFGGSANAASFKEDINMYVDYVRVYKKDAGYPEYATKTAGSGMADDWADFAGQNQIAEITETNVLPPADDANNKGGMDDRTSDSANWYLSYQDNVADNKPSVTPFKDEDEKVWAKLTIPKAGSPDYAVQLIGHYDAKGGYVYKVSFDAYAEGDMVGKQVNSDSKEWSGWSAYGIQSFTLSDTPETVSYMIAQTEDFDKCRIEFNVGGVGTGTVYIGNVKVEIIDPELFGSTEEDGARKPLGDGNVIYNGTFDQGDKHIGYWSAADGTTLEVPRYTTTKITDSDVSVVDVASKIIEETVDGIKYYERRAEISATTGAPSIYQSGMKLGADTYTLTFDMYSAANTTVNAAIYSTDEEGALVAKVVDKTMNYSASAGLKNFSWAPVLEEEVTNAALVLTFGEGAAVQVDNVVMIGDSLKPYIDPNPLKADGVWTGDNGAGGALPLEVENGVTTLKNVTSGGNWYSPQIGSPNFALTSGQVYKFTGKFKLTGTSNNTVDFIIQENGGGWYVYGAQQTLTYDPATADEDGFCSFEYTFTAGQSLETVHANFGLGKSEASGAADFSFKDVVMNLVVPEEPEEPIVFSDIEENLNDWKYLAALYAVENGLMAGTAVDEETGVITFDPLGTVTRGQFVTILYNAAGTPDVEYSDKFTDVTDITKWYAKPVLWAAENGIVSGKPDGSFDVYGEISRQDMAVMLMNYADFCGLEPDERADLSGYVDEALVSNYAKEAVQWANEMGIINGKPGSKLDPKGTATRAEAATVMRNFNEAYAE